MNKNVTFRPMTEADTGILMGFIWEMARYEHLEDQVVVTEELLREWLFEKHAAEVIFALVDGKEVGSALFFSSFSTFLGRGGLYLEDLIVLPEYRHQGYGKALLKELARIAVERGCGRLEWSCLDWNQPSIDFYLSLGAQPLDQWTEYRVTGETLRRLAERMANRARRTGHRVALEPMNPYERRVLHSALQDNPYVTTHSEGEEPYRRVVITLK